MAKNKMSLREKLIAKREDIKNRNKGGNMIFFKAGTTRIRPVPVGDDVDWGVEVLHFYLGKELKGVISPKSMGEKCALNDAYEDLNNSKDEKDRKLAKKLKPKRKFVVAVYQYKDERGNEVDMEKGVRLALLPTSVYNDMLDLYLDPDNGDFTDPINGYDIKVRRTGENLDTEYSALPGKPSKAHKKFRGPYNLEELLKAEIPTYKETKALRDKFLNLDLEDDDDEDDRPKKKKSIKGKDSKKRKSDL